MRDLFQRAVDGVIDFFLTPVQAIYDFLTDPNTFINLTNRVADAMHTADATLYAYSLPAIFTSLGLLFYLVGLAYNLLAFQRGAPARRVLPPILLGGVLLPLFAYGGPGCVNEGFPCVPKVRYEKETVPSSQFSTYQEARFRFDGGRLVMEEVSKDTGVGVVPEYVVFRAVPEGRIPPGTAVGLALVDTASLVGKRVFYSSLARYQENMGQLREVYQKLTRTAFTLMATSAFTGKVGEAFVDAAVGSLIPIPGGKKVVGQARKKVREFFAEKAPPFLRFMLGTTGMTTVRGAQEVAARTARVNMSLAQVLASLPLLLVLSFATVFYLAVMGAKLAVYAVPLAAGLSLFAPQALYRFFNLALVLVVFPVVLGSFFSLATRVLFVGGIERQISTFEEKAAKMLESFYIQNPTASLAASQTALLIYHQVQNLAACLNAPLPPDWDPERRGRDLADGGAVGGVGCYPAYGVSRYLDPGYQIPSDPAAIRLAAVDIARQFSLDLANTLGPDGSFKRGSYILPKGEGSIFHGMPTFKNEGVYGRLPLSNVGPQDPEEGARFAGHTPHSSTPLEVGAIARKALALMANPTKEGLEELLSDIRSFQGAVASLAAKKNLVEDGAAVRDFIQEGIRWEIAWHYAPEFVLEGLQQDVQQRLGSAPPKEIADALRQTPPPILDETLGAYSPLYALKSGKEGAPETLLPASDLPLPVGGSEKAKSFFSPQAVPATNYNFLRLADLCTEDKPDYPSCRLGYNEAPYLPYVYLDHYEVLNQLGMDAFGALSKMQSRQLMGLIYLALVIAMALSLFRSLLQVMSTLMEGLGPSARGMVTQVGQAVASIATYAPRVPAAFPLGGGASSAAETSPSFRLLGQVEREQSDRVRETFAPHLREMREVFQEAKEGFSGPQGDLAVAYRKVVEDIGKLLPLAEGLRSLNLSFHLDPRTYQEAESALRQEASKPVWERVVWLELPYNPAWLQGLARLQVEARLKKILPQAEGLGPGYAGTSLAMLATADLEGAKKKLAAEGYAVEEEGGRLVVRDQRGIPLALISRKGEAPIPQKFISRLESERFAHPVYRLVQEAEGMADVLRRRLEGLFRQAGYRFRPVAGPEGVGLAGYVLERGGRTTALIFRSTPVDIEDQLRYLAQGKEGVAEALAAYAQGTLAPSLPYELWLKETASKRALELLPKAAPAEAQEGKAVPVETQEGKPEAPKEVPAVPVAFLSQGGVFGEPLGQYRVDYDKAAETAIQSPELARRMVADLAVLQRRLSDEEGNFYKELFARVGKRPSEEVELFRNTIIKEVEARREENRIAVEYYFSLLEEALQKRDEEAFREHLDTLRALKVSGDSLAFLASLVPQKLREDSDGKEKALPGEKEQKREKELRFLYRLEKAEGGYQQRRAFLTEGGTGALYQRFLEEQARDPVRFRTAFVDEVLGMSQGQGGGGKNAGA